MARFAFTDLSLRQLSFSTATDYHWDTRMPYLGLRVGIKTKVFVALHRNGRRQTLGRFPYLTLADARKRVFKLRQAPYVDPNALRLSQALKLYMTARTHALRATTLRETTAAWRAFNLSKKRPSIA